METTTKGRALGTAVVALCCAVSAARAQVPASPPGWEVIDRYCTKCHNFEDWAGQLAFDTVSRDDIPANASVWERVIGKLRTGLMPPAGEQRPERAVLEGVAGWLEHEIDSHGTANPGEKLLARMNRVEYANAVRDLLAFDADAVMHLLPEETVPDESFDNLAENLGTSPTLLEGYVAAAMEISRQAVGNPAIGATDIHYYRDGNGAQMEHIDGMAPGTRGGMSVMHNFPLDAEYVIRVSANIQTAGWKNDQGRMFWCNGPTVDVAFDDRQIPVEDYRSFRVKVPAGPHRIAVALVDERDCAGAAELFLGEALASRSGAVQQIEVQGPFNATGSGDSPSRQRVFSCQPRSADDEAACARQILSTLATRAYRQLVAPGDPLVDRLMALYELGRSEEGGNFELGVQYGLSRLLVDPRFIYRFEREPEGLEPGATYAISDRELATRLSFFLWSSIPDDELLVLAEEQRLSDPQVLQAQVQRMLQDARASALIDNFVGQWLQLREFQEARPRDAEFDEALRSAMRAETELLFASMVRENRSMLDLLDANYTYLNERLARHYGIEGIHGSYMRRVELPADSPRRGLLGQGSILTATSIPNRTSPVVRGVWVVENLMGAPIPDPPPGVEANLDVSVAEDRAMPTTLRGRLEQHRQDPVCASCHGTMDPIGLALEHFDHTGRWRDKDNGLAIDAASTMVDGTAIDGAVALREALLLRPEAFMRALAGKLMTYALGRELDYHDGTALRGVVAHSHEQGNSFASLVAGIVASEPFRKRVAQGGQPDNALAAIINDTAGTGRIAP
ncbi:MAG TPA: DUF1592 domain-containing protein [Hyphomicrobiales bacterium]|nr:DUF1592 domain-containing protein [Hyphomicrobiales bacterium]